MRAGLRFDSVLNVDQGVVLGLLRLIVVVVALQCHVLLHIVIVLVASRPCKIGRQ